MSSRKVQPSGRDNPTTNGNAPPDRTPGMNLSRITRLLKLIGLLQAGRAYNTEALAQACGVSRRTIFRDLDALRQAGVPLIYNDQKQHYHIPGTYFLPPTNFTPDEALALLVLCNDLGDRSQLPFFEPARAAVLKVASSLPQRLREELRLVSDAIRMRLEPVNPLAEQQPVYQQLLDALAERRSVRIRYSSLAEGEVRGQGGRDAEPRERAAPLQEGPPARLRPEAPDHDRSP